VRGPPRVLVVCYSQTGQLKRCADALVAPMQRAGVEVDFLTPRPAKPYNFPWSFSEFLDVFPDSVKGVAPQMDPVTLKPPQARYDLVIVAYQVWYLAPALPIVGWLESEAANLLNGAPVVALCACRNMWQRAFVALKALIAAKGGRLIDHVVREDSGPAWATFWSTPRWVLTGDRVGKTGLLPVAGVSDDDIATLSKPGEKLRDALEAGRLSSSVLEGAEARIHRVFVIPELVARFFFCRWAELICASGPLRAFMSRLFFVSLCSSLLLMVPGAVVALFIRLFARGWFQGKVDEVTA
jgi:hypothetical protein